MVFERALVGCDGSPAALQALALARRLCAPDAELLALTVAETYYATHAGMDAAAWDSEIRGKAEEARAAAERELAGVPGAQATLVTGYAAKALLAAADSMHADLIAVGAHGHGRISGILLGSVATRVVHDARCSVLVARGEVDPARFPASITVGIDSSDASREANAVAEAIAADAGVPVRQVAAKGSPLHALLEASQGCGLLVVGTRSLHGLQALGSVAERLAHEAACPVLIVRSASQRAQDEAGPPMQARAH